MADKTHVGTVLIKNEVVTMLSLIYLVYLIAFWRAIIGQKKQAIGLFVAAIVISLYWLMHHATSTLKILL